MKFVIFLVLLVGFASSTKLKLDSVESVDDILAVKPHLVDVKREKRSYKSSAPAAYTCFRRQGSFRWKANCNFPQHDHSRIAAHNLADCLTACSKNAKCTHFTYNIATKTCYQKHSNVNLKDEPAEEGICGLKNAVSPAKLADNGLGRNCWNSNEGGLSSWGAHCKFDGQELDSFSTSSFANCRVACKDNQQCTHFNFDYVNKMCHLIQATTNPLIETPEDNFFCGLSNQRSARVQPIASTTIAKTIPKSSAPAAYTCFRGHGSFRWKANCNFPQHDHSRIAAHNLADCLTACSKNAKCTHFTYNIATKTCYQKHSNVNLKDEPAEEGICGLKNAVSPAKLADNGLGRNCWNSNEGGLSSWGAHCKFDGQKLDSFSTGSFANCRVACKDNQQCTHFNFDYVNKMCHLIQATTNPLIETPEDNFFCGLSNQRSARVQPVASITTAKPIPNCWSTEQKPLSTRVTYKGDKCGFPGDDIKIYKTSNLTDCRISCSNEQKCTHFTLQVLDKTCFLKHKTKLVAPIWREHGICGFVADPNALIPKCP